MNHKNFIRGNVRVYDKDKRGAALQLYIQTDSFEKYIIENNNASDELFSLLDEEVIIDCKDCYKVDEMNYVVVDAFKVIKKESSSR